MSRTFCIFDTEHGIDDSLPLLGRLVANPRRPLDDYQPDKKSPMPDNFKHEVVSQKSTSMTTEAIRTVKVAAGLGALVGLESSTDTKYTYTISADEFKTYALQQCNNSWEALKQKYETEIKDFIRTHQGKAYFIVSLKTATKSIIERGAEQGTSGGGKGSIPLAAATGGAVPPFIGDPNAEVNVGGSTSTTIKGEIDREVALAAEYRVVALVPKYKFSFQKLVSRDQILENKGSFDRSRGNKFAFSGDDDDSDVEEDSDDDEKFI